jgi:hypothetical protein
MDRGRLTPPARAGDTSANASIVDAKAATPSASRRRTTGTAHITQRVSSMLVAISRWWVGQVFGIREGRKGSGLRCNISCIVLAWSYSTEIACLQGGASTKPRALHKFGHLIRQAGQALSASDFDHAVSMDTGRVPE